MYVLVAYKPAARINSEQFLPEMYTIGVDSQTDIIKETAHFIMKNRMGAKPKYYIYLYNAHLPIVVRNVVTGNHGGLILFKAEELAKGRLNELNGIFR